MEDLQFQYLRAAAIATLSFTAFVVVTRLAWRSNLYFARRARAWCRELPARFRALRDPEFRHEREVRSKDDGRFRHYETLNVFLQRARTGRKNAEHVLLHLVDPLTPGMMGDIHVEACVRHEESRRAVAAYFADLTDDDIASLARGINAGLCGGSAPSGELEDFLHDERESIRLAPERTDTHLARLVKRFAPYMARKVENIED